MPLVYSRYFVKKILKIFIKKIKKKLKKIKKLYIENKLKKIKKIKKISIQGI